MKTKYTEEEKINALLTIFLHARNSDFNISTDYERKNLLEAFHNEYCTTRYKGIKNILEEAQEEYKIYTTSNLEKFFKNQTIIDYIKEHYPNKKIIYSKKYLESLLKKNEDNEDLRKDILEREKILKLEQCEQDYTKFLKSDVHMYRKKFDGINFKKDNTIVVYDSDNPTNKDVVIQFPLNKSLSISEYKNYMNMCKFDWCKLNGYDPSKKYFNTKATTLDNYLKNILNS